MWCCAGKPEIKKPLVKGPKEQTRTKCILNISPKIHLQFINKQWVNEANASKKGLKTQAPKSPQQTAKAKQLQSKVAQLSTKRDALYDSSLVAEVQKQKIDKQLKLLKQKVQESQAKQKILAYLIAKQELRMDNYALKIQT